MRPRRLALPLLVVAVAIAHAGTTLVTRASGIPFRLESWATIAGVATGGFAVGASGAVLANLALALAGGRDPLWLELLGALVTAAVAALLIARGWVDIQHPFRLVGAGVVLALATGALATLSPGAPDVLTFRTRLAATLGIDGGAVVVERLLLALVDRTLAVIVAAAVVALAEERFPWARRGRVAHGSG